MMTTVFHAGERLVQQRTGEQAVAERNGRIISTQMPGGVAAFLAKQSFAVASSLDALGQVWTSLLVGTPGFAHAPSLEQLKLETALLVPAATDVFWRNLPERPAIGLLFIELSTRRRFRLNGRVRAVATGWVVDIEQAFPNCPKYIQRREVALMGSAATPPAAYAQGHALTPDLKTWITSADTFFLGSSDNQHQLDASHRGGAPGFVQVRADGQLWVPDYAGNSMYNTLGNFALNPAAGLLFVDFAHGRTLQLTGHATIEWQVPGAEAATGGTGRYWRFAPQAWVVQPLPARLLARFIDYSPFNPTP